MKGFIVGLAVALTLVAGIAVAEEPSGTPIRDTPHVTPIRGDADCDGEVTIKDGLWIIRSTVSLVVPFCYVMAEPTCDPTAYPAQKTLAILLAVAALPYSQSQPCEPIGAIINAANCTWGNRAYCEPASVLPSPSPHVSMTS